MRRGLENFMRDNRKICDEFAANCSQPVMVVLTQELDPNLLLGTPDDAAAPVRTPAAEHEPEFVRDIVLTRQCDPRSLLRNIADRAVAVGRAVADVYGRPLLRASRQ